MHRQRPRQPYGYQRYRCWTMARKPSLPASSWTSESLTMEPRRSCSLMILMEPFSRSSVRLASGHSPAAMSTLETRSTFWARYPIRGSYPSCTPAVIVSISRGHPNTSSPLGSCREAGCCSKGTSSAYVGSLRQIPPTRLFGSLTRTWIIAYRFGATDRTFRVSCRRRSWSKGS